MQVRQCVNSGDAGFLPSICFSLPHSSFLCFFLLVENLYSEGVYTLGLFLFLLLGAKLRVLAMASQPSTTELQPLETLQV